MRLTVSTKKEKTKKVKKKKKKSEELKKPARLGKKGSDEAKRAAGRKMTFARPSKQAQNAAKKALEDSDGLHKLRDGMNRILMLPAPMETGLILPWQEVKAHYCGGKDAMAALGMERPDDIPMVHACLKFHQKRSCRWDEFIATLRKSRNHRDRAFADALWANLNCYANIVDLRTPKVVRPFRFGKKIRDVLAMQIDAGVFFYDPDGLMEIRINKKKTGPGITNVEYSTLVMPRVISKLKNRWIRGLHDLTQFIPPIPTPEEIQETIDTLFAVADDGDDMGLSSSDLTDDDDDDDISF